MKVGRNVPGASGSRGPEKTHAHKGKPSSQLMASVATVKDVVKEVPFHGHSFQRKAPHGAKEVSQVFNKTDLPPGIRHHVKVQKKQDPEIRAIFKEAVA